VAGSVIVTMKMTDECKANKICLLSTNNAVTSHFFARKELSIRDEKKMKMLIT
jgi:hypothetical protein